MKTLFTAVAAVILAVSVGNSEIRASEKDESGQAPSTAAQQTTQKNWLRRFFSSVPHPPLVLGLEPPPPVRKTEWRPLVSLPALKITESTRPNTKVDALLLTSVGGGISLQYLEEYTDNSDPQQPIKKWKSLVTWSPLTALLSGNLTADNPLDLSVASTIGFWDSRIMFGGGYDLGKVTGRSRWFGLLSIGINFNN